MPEALARTGSLTFLDKKERMILNQIRGHGYLYIFGLVEEFILPFVMDHARERLDGDDAQTRAFLGFAAEEAKHIDLFRRFRADFENGFGTQCQVIGPPDAVAKAMLGHSPLSVASDSCRSTDVGHADRRHVGHPRLVVRCVRPGPERPTTIRQAVDRRNQPTEPVRSRRLAGPGWM